jgi:hypothetical protein
LAGPGKLALPGIAGPEQTKPAKWNKAAPFWNIHGTASGTFGEHPICN